MINIDELIQQANDLAPLPASTVRLAQLVSSPDYHMDEVVALIDFDQALTVKLLRAANSAAEASKTKVGTVIEAVLRLGAARILSMAVATGAKPLLQNRIPAYGLDEGGLWRHSVAAAVAAEVLPGFCQQEIPPESFTAALLHDVGKLVMGRFIDPKILGYIQQAQEVEKIGRLEAEMLIIKVHHAELGGLIARHWQLPERVAQAIGYHHQPELPHERVCDVTYVANQIAKSIEAGLEGRTVETIIDPEVTNRIGLALEKLPELCSTAVTRYQQVSLRYNAT